MEVAVLGGGCFWCVEALLHQLKGVKKVTVGYCGGHLPDPTYKQVKTGNTGHIEVAKVEFDSSILSYGKLLEIFMDIHDPTQEDGQGEEDIGSQYLSVIFIQIEKQREVAELIVTNMAAEVAKDGKKIFTQIRD